MLPKRRQSHQGDKLCDVSTVPLVARWPVFLARGSDADGEPHYNNDVCKSGYWREASSLILAAPSAAGVSSQETQDQPDYKVLMVKRSSRSAFAPNVWVFPGGTTDHQDFNEGWKDVFEHVVGIPFKQLTSSLVITPNRDDIFAAKRETSFPAEVAFRITAIRETFEESGVLLVTPTGDFSSLAGAVQDKCRPAGLCGSSGWKWRQKIREDASAFRDLCRHLGVVPNVWALRSWSNWLTPPSQQLEKPPARPRRYDTMFFTCCLDEMPRAEADQQETSASLVSGSSQVSTSLVGVN